MEHFRLRKYRGPEVWARVRVAYEAGESGPSLARRFDVGLANLRKKCRLEGWSRRHQAERLDRELVGQLAPTPSAVRVLAAPAPSSSTTPAQATAAAVSRASSALADGRAGEALTLLKAAEALARAPGAPSIGTQPAPEDEPERQARLATARAALWEEIEQQAGLLAEQLLADESQAPVVFGGFAYLWRGAVLGPACAAADWARAREHHWAERYWTEDGRLKPLEEIRAETRGAWVGSA